ncbi:MAG: hypothetical protein AAF581_08620, partial [Planctomycetota bacterium]
GKRYYLSRDLGAAEEQFTRSMRILRSVNCTALLPSVAFGARQRGLILIMQGSYDEATKMLQQSIAAVDKMEAGEFCYSEASDHRLHALVSLGIAEMKQAQSAVDDQGIRDRWGAAHAHFSAAQKVFQACGGPSFLGAEIDRLTAMSAGQAAPP